MHKACGVGVAAVVLAMLAGCGGGDGGSGGAPIATPTPSPTPTASPTPAPVSPAAYTADFSYQTALGYAATLFYADESNPTSVDGTLLADGDTTALTYTVNPEKALFRFSAGAISFAGTDLVIAAPWRFYRRGDEDLLLGLATTPPLTYVTRAGWRSSQGEETRLGRTGQRRIIRYGLIGPVTPADATLVAHAAYAGTPFATGGPRD